MVIGLKTWMDDHPGEVEAFMTGFIRSDAPKPQPWAEVVYRLRPRRITGKRALIDDLPVERQTVINSAGRLLWTAAAAARTRRVLDDDQRQARANDVAKALIVEMLDLFGAPRLKSVAVLTRMFVGERPSMRQAQYFVKANPSRSLKRPR
jgi:hypothetical protein